MEVWFSIQIAWKTPLKTNLSPGKLEFTDLLHGIPFFQGWPGILHPSCMDIKWNTTFSDIKTHFKITFNTEYCSSTSRLSCLQDQGIIVFFINFSLIFHLHSMVLTISSCHRLVSLYRNLLA